MSREGGREEVDICDGVCVCVCGCVREISHERVYISCYESTRYLPM